MAISIQTTQYTLIYVYSIDDDNHRGALKIGKASVDAYDVMELLPNCDALNKAAIERIKAETVTAGIDFKLLYTEVAYFKDSEGKRCSFDDYTVRDVLKHSGYKKKDFNLANGDPQEWFEVDLETAIKAIAAVKNEQEVIDGPPKEEKEKEPIIFREEQQHAIDSTIAHFATGHQYLWNAKMRFGKTLCALELIRQKEYNRVLILTHRPAVRGGWFEDYHKLDFKNQQYGSKKGDKFAFCDEKDDKGKDFPTLEKNFVEKGIRYIYFASMQDLRGSKKVSDKGINKNDDVFQTDWDLIILDEAHEGTETLLGKNVIKGLLENRSPYLLYLSGTPFNILHHFTSEEIYTWDYEMEQDAKKNWHKNHPTEPNPYEGLARVNIYTYNLGDVFETSQYTRTEEDFFNFTEFFRVWTGDEKSDGASLPYPEAKGKFVHEGHIIKFLDMLCDESAGSRYPYSNEQFRQGLSHTLWMLPGVDGARALEQLIHNHPLCTKFGYKTINVAGEGSKIEGLDEDDAKKIEKLGKDMLKRVQEAVKIFPHTITLSCGRLTTGVSVPEWTGVFMMRGGYDVDAGNYMQTIFRGQTPFKNGAIKSNCYAFDFAPDRTLSVIDEYIDRKPQPSGKKREKGERIESLLRLCPVIAMKGGQEIEYNAHKLIDQVNRAYKDHVMANGFKGRMLHKSFADFTQSDHDLLAEIGKIFEGNKVKTTSDGKVKMSDSGLKGEESNKTTKSKKKKSTTSSRTKSQTKEEEERRKRSQNVLDQIFVRLPLMLFGAVEDTSHLSIAELLKDEVIDQPSWEEFMPEGFGKPMLQQIAHLVKEELLISCTAEIITKTKEADGLPVEQRVVEIARMLSTFHYPDHETVLTPWWVVNMHMGITVGGYNFYDEQYRNLLPGSPRWVECKPFTDRVFSVDSQVLEINSKSGVYPLYLTYTLWRIYSNADHPQSVEKEYQLWDKVLLNNMFILCKTEMAKKITERVLTGYRKVETHCNVYPKLVETLRLNNTKKNKQKKEKLVKELNSCKYWNVNNGKKDMKFNAVVSNPPYNIGVNKEPLYHLFIDLGRQASELGSIIHPGRFLFNAGKTPKKWNKKMFEDEHYKVVRYWANGSDVFDNVEIKGGVAITMWDAKSKFEPIGTFIRQEELREIKDIVWANATENFSANVYPRDLYQLKELFYTEHPELEGKQSEGHRFDVGTTIFTLFPEVFYEEAPNADDYALIVGRENDVRIAKWIKSSYLKLPDNFDSYKVFIPVANGSGKFGEALGEPIVGIPKHAHTVTFLSVGKFETEEEAVACVKYIKTKFARTMLGIRKVTHHTTKEAWVFVPNQDFSSNSDIDWTKSIHEIDQALYAKYGIEDYADYIEQNVKSME